MLRHIQLVSCDHNPPRCPLPPSGSVWHLFMKKVPDSAKLGRWGAIQHPPLVTILSRKSIAPYIFEAM